MDLSITRLTPEIHQARGAKAYDEGLDVNDHGMNENTPARKDWQYGWHMQRVERSRARGIQPGQQLEACPP